MKNFINWRGYLFIPVFLIVFYTSVKAELPDTSINKLKKNLVYITEASHLFDIKAEYLMAIVYIERTLNVNWQDYALDIVLAKSGYSSSIGFCQVKLKTAYFIKKALFDTTSIFYPGAKYNKIIPVSKTPEEIITKLSIDSLNIYYAAAYLRIVQNFWKLAGHNIDEKPGILGTLYSIGLYDQNGHVRKPNSNPKLNNFGKKVLIIVKLFYSMLFIDSR